MSKIIIAILLLLLGLFAFGAFILKIFIMMVPFLLLGGILSICYLYYKYKRTIKK